MRALTRKFSQLPAREKKQITLIVLLTFLGCYGLVAAHLWQTLFEAQKMADRRANRIETRIGDYKPPEIDASLTPEQLSAAEHRLSLTEKQLIALSERLMPLDTPDPRENLKLELTRLAQAHQVAISHLLASDDTLRPLPEVLSGQALRDIFSKRPVFKVKGQGRYYDLIALIESLHTLPYRSFISTLVIARPEVDSGDDLLQFSFDLQM